jgi:hypothetical protein
VLTLAEKHGSGSGHASIHANSIGAIVAVVLGGICTVACAVLWARWFPALRRTDDLTETEELRP